MTDKEKRLIMKTELKNLTPELDIKEMLRKANPQPLPVKPIRRTNWGYGVVGAFATIFLVAILMYGINNIAMDKAMGDHAPNDKDDAAHDLFDQEKLFALVSVGFVYLDQQSNLESDQSTLNQDLVFVTPYVSIFDAYRTTATGNALEKTAPQLVGYDYRLVLKSSRDEEFVIHYKPNQLYVEAMDRSYIINFSQKNHQYVFTYEGEKENFRITGTATNRITVESDAQNRKGVLTTVEWDGKDLNLKKTTASYNQVYKIEYTSNEYDTIHIEYLNNNLSNPQEGVTRGQFLASNTGAGYLYQGYIGDFDVEQIVPNN